MLFTCFDTGGQKIRVWVSPIRNTGHCDDNCRKNGQTITLCSGNSLYLLWRHSPAQYRRTHAGDDSPIERIQQGETYLNLIDLRGSMTIEEGAGLCSRLWFLWNESEMKIQWPSGHRFRNNTSQVRSGVHTRDSCIDPDNQAGTIQNSCSGWNRSYGETTIHTYSPPPSESTSATGIRQSEPHGSSSPGWTRFISKNRRETGERSPGFGMSLLYDDSP